jgi:hypothetical protein
LTFKNSLLAAVATGVRKVVAEKPMVLCSGLISSGIENENSDGQTEKVNIHGLVAWLYFIG